MDVGDAVSRQLAAARLRRARLQAEQKVRKSEPVPHVLELRMSQDAQVVITAYAQHWLDRRRRVRSRSYSRRSLLEDGTAPASRLDPAAAPSAAPAADPVAALASRGPASARPDLAAVHIATDGCGLHSVTISPNDAAAPAAAPSPRQEASGSLARRAASPSCAPAMALAAAPAATQQECREAAEELLHKRLERRRSRTGYREMATGVAAVQDAAVKQQEAPRKWVVKEEALSLELELREPAGDRAKKAFRSVHVKARSQHPAYPVRAEVEDKHVPWDERASQYEAVEFTHKVVFANDSTKERGNGNNGWADPPDPANPAIDWSTRESYEGPMQFSAAGNAPINPRGRTGMQGRGLLGKWGPNHAADPIVTRFDPVRPGVLQVVAIKRKDTGDWALPGGMIDAGEKVSLTVRREFEEEAGNLAEFPELQRQFRASVDELFASGKEVYRVRAAARTPRCALSCSFSALARRPHVGRATWTTPATPTTRGWRRRPSTSTARRSLGRCCRCMRATMRPRSSG